MISKQPTMFAKQEYARVSTLVIQKMFINIEKSQNKIIVVNRVTLSLPFIPIFIIFVFEASFFTVMIMIYIYIYVKLDSI